LTGLDAFATSARFSVTVAECVPFRILDGGRLRILRR
jgi:hypothetical protein